MRFSSYGMAASAKEPLSIQCSGLDAYECRSDVRTLRQGRTRSVTRPYGWNSNFLYRLVKAHVATWCFGEFRRSGTWAALSWPPAIPDGVVPNLFLRTAWLEDVMFETRIVVSQETFDGSIGL